MANSPARHDSLKAKFQAQFDGYRDEQSITSCTVEMVDACIRQLKRGKAAGHDQLTVEHFASLGVPLDAHGCSGSED